MKLTQILLPDCIKVPLESSEKEAAITELVDLLDSQGLLLDRDVVLDAVMMREKTRSTGIGSGIAIPHGKCKATKELIMAVGITQKPLDFESVDNKPVTIIMLLVSPIDQTGPHIQALARISRLMLDGVFKNQLENADSSQQAYELITAKEDR